MVCEHEAVVIIPADVGWRGSYRIHTVVYRGKVGADVVFVVVIKNLKVVTVL